MSRAGITPINIASSHVGLSHLGNGKSTPQPNTVTAVNQERANFMGYSNSKYSHYASSISGLGSVDVGEIENPQYQATKSNTPRNWLH